jgi:ComF family protein
VSLDYKKLFHFLFPPSENEMRITNSTIESFMQRTEIRCTNEVYSILRYQDAYVRSAIHLLKFHNHTQAKKLLSAALVYYLSQARTDEYVIIPIPLSKKRERTRGYNQVTEVIRTASPSLARATLELNILLRTRNTTPQTSLPRTQRLHNVQNAFAIKNKLVAKEKLTGQHVVLVDDVLTTGATLKAACKILATCEPRSITCVALAH